MLQAIRNLDYVILLCQELRQMRAFYHDALGFPIYRELEGWIELRVGAVLLTLPKRGRPYDGVKAGEHAGVQLAFRVTPSQVGLLLRRAAVPASADSGAAEVPRLRA